MKIVYTCSVTLIISLFMTEAQQIYSLGEGLVYDKDYYNALEDFRKLSTALKHGLQEIGDIKETLNFKISLKSENVDGQPIPVPETSTCSKGWMQRKKSCYIIPNVTETWAHAAAHCHALGARLAMISSPGEHTFLQEVLRSLKTNQNKGYVWVDGTDEALETHWVYGRTQTELVYRAFGRTRPQEDSPKLLIIR